MFKNVEINLQMIYYNFMFLIYQAYTSDNLKIQHVPDSYHYLYVHTMNLSRVYVTCLYHTNAMEAFTFINILCLKMLK